MIYDPEIKELLMNNGLNIDNVTIFFYEIEKYECTGITYHPTYSLPRLLKMYKNSERILFSIGKTPTKGRRFLSSFLNKSQIEKYLKLRSFL